MIVVGEGKSGSAQELDDLNLTYAYLYPLRHRSGHDRESTAITREAEGLGVIFCHFCRGALMMRKIPDNRLTDFCKCPEVFGALVARTSSWFVSQSFSKILTKAHMYSVSVSAGFFSSHSSATDIPVL